MHSETQLAARHDRSRRLVSMTTAQRCAVQRASPTIATWWSTGFNDNCARMHSESFTTCYIACAYPVSPPLVLRRPFLCSEPRLVCVNLLISLLIECRFLGRVLPDTPNPKSRIACLTLGTSQAAWRSVRHFLQACWDRMTFHGRTDGTARDG